MPYRRDIDGLRAVAITLVLLFHAGLPAVSGGFVGVDVFFVISGFLITGIVAREIAENRFSLLSFYERRARRLLPALAVVLLCSTLAGLWLLMPAELVDFAKSLRATGLFIANVHFADSSYFAPAVEDAPLLHMWSLGVEEQFYLFLPLLLIVLTRRGRKAAPWVAAIAAASFVASLWAVREDPRGAFFLLHFRAWELLIGSLLALRVFPQIGSRVLAEAGGLSGLLLIGGSAILITPETPFPGVAALAPCIGTALVIHCGAAVRTTAGSLLGARIPVFVGLISYPLYLWHWPVLVFAKEYAQRHLTPAEAAAALLASFVLAALTWHFIEMPVRTRRWITSRRAILSGAAAVAAAGIAVFFSAELTRGFPNRLPPQIASVAVGTFDRNVRDGACARVSARRIDNNDFCELGDSAAAAATFALIGDSHANAMIPAVDAAARRAGKRGAAIVRVACAPLRGVRLFHVKDNYESKRCAVLFEKFIEHIRSQSEIDTVIVVARWRPLDVEAPSYYQDDQSRGLTPAESLAAFERGLTRTLRAFAGRRVFITEPIPEFEYSVPTFAAREMMAGRQAPVIARDAFERQKAATRAAIERIAAREGATVLKTSEAFCDAAVCRSVKDGHALYFDWNHPSLFASRFLEPTFAPAFAAPADTLSARSARK